MVMCVDKPRVHKVINLDMDEFLKCLYSDVDVIVDLPHRVIKDLVSEFMSPILGLIYSAVSFAADTLPWPLSILARRAKKMIADKIKEYIVNSIANTIEDSAEHMLGKLIYCADMAVEKKKAKMQYN